MLGGIYFIIGWLASKNITTTTDYFLADRSLGLIPVTFTLIATQLGSGMLLGTSQQAYQIGLYGILYTLGMSIGFVLLGCGLAAKLRSLNIATTAELFETKYNSPRLKYIASSLSILTMCGLLIGQVVASKLLIAGLGMDNEYIFIAFWAFIITYTMAGGLKAVVITDLFQVLFIIIIFGGLFLYALLFGSPSSVPLFSLIQQQHLFATSSLTLSSTVAILLMPALFSLIEQDLAQRFFAARSQRIAALSALCVSCFMIAFSFIPIYFGMQAKISNIPLASGANPLIPFLSTITPEVIVILAICAIIAAITSTADSLLCAISSNIVQDFDVTRLGIKNRLTFSKIATSIVGIGALIASYFVPQDIINILIASYELSVSCLLIPLLFSYFKDNLKKEAAIGSMVGGLIGLILFRIIPIPIPKEIATLILSLIGYMIGSKITNK